MLPPDRCARRDRPDACRSAAAPAWADVKRVVPPRCRVDRQDDARRARSRERYGTVWNPEYGRPYTQIGATARRAVDERGVHAHRPHPLLVRGLPRRLAHARCSSGHRRVHDRGLPRGLPRPARDRLRRPRRRGTYDLFVVCGLDVPWRARRDPRVRGAAPDGCTSATSSGRRASGSAVAARRGARSRSGSRRLRRRSTACSHGARLGDESDRRRHEGRHEAGTLLSPSQATRSIELAAGGGLGCPGGASRRERTVDLSGRSGARRSSAP